MQTQREMAVLSRDCEALLIPAAVAINIPAGTLVEITQALGGNYTVYVNGNLLQINAENADALGKTKNSDTTSPESDFAQKELTLNHIYEVLRECYDPEIPVNIVDLGLVYECRLEPSTAEKSNIFIKMTLTSPTCSMGPVLQQDIQQKLLRHPNVDNVNFEWVFDPPWNREQMSEAARLQLGLL